MSRRNLREKKSLPCTYTVTFQDLLAINRKLPSPSPEADLIASFSRIDSQDAFDAMVQHRLRNGAALLELDRAWKERPQDLVAPTSAISIENQPVTTPTSAQPAVPVIGRKRPRPADFKNEESEEDAEDAAQILRRQHKQQEQQKTPDTRRQQQKQNYQTNLAVLGLGDRDKAKLPKSLYNHKYSREIKEGRGLLSYPPELLLQGYIDQFRELAALFHVSMAELFTDPTVFETYHAKNPGVDSTAALEKVKPIIQLEESDSAAARLFYKILAELPWAKDINGRFHFSSIITEEINKIIYFSTITGKEHARLPSQQRVRVHKKPTPLPLPPSASSSSSAMSAYSSFSSVADIPPSPYGSIEPAPASSNPVLKPWSYTIDMPMLASSMAAVGGYDLSSPQLRADLQRGGFLKNQAQSATAVQRTLARGAHYERGLASKSPYAVRSGNPLMFGAPQKKTPVAKEKSAQLGGSLFSLHVAAEG